MLREEVSYTSRSIAASTAPTNDCAPLSRRCVAHPTRVILSLGLARLAWRAWSFLALAAALALLAVVELARARPKAVHDGAQHARRLSHLSYHRAYQGQALATYQSARGNDYFSVVQNLSYTQQSQFL